MKKVVKVLLLSALITVLFAGTAFASGLGTLTTGEEKEIIVHVKNQFDWPNLNIYNWGDAGECFGAWPGTAITDEPDENGWITYTFKATANLNLLFNSDYNEDGLFDKINDKQTGDIKDIPVDIGECWIIISGEEAGTEDELNPYEVDAAATGYLYSVPKDTWPKSEGFVAPTEELYTQVDVEFEPTAAPATETPVEESTKEEVKDDEIVDTNANSSSKAASGSTFSSVIILPIVVIGILSVIAIVVVVIVVVNKKKNNNE